MDETEAGNIKQAKLAVDDLIKRARPASKR